MLGRRRSGAETGNQHGNAVGDRVEHQVDRHPREVGADAVVRTGAAELKCGLGFRSDVERERILEHVLVEVGRPVEQHQPLPLLDRHAAELGVLTSAVR